jgi:hypothetical protein
MLQQADAGLIAIRLGSIFSQEKVLPSLIGEL